MYGGSVSVAALLNKGVGNIDSVFLLLLITSLSLLPTTPELISSNTPIGDEK